MHPPPPEGVTVTVMEVVADSEPEVPVIVTVAVPGVAVVLAVNVIAVELVDEVGLNEAVTPVGRPAAANITLPVNPFESATVIVSVAVLPWVTARVAVEAASVKLCVELVTLRTMLVFAVAFPEVPVIVTVTVPSVAVVLAVNVSTLELVDDSGLNEAVTPLGRPVMAKATLPANPPTSVILMVSVPDLPCATDREAGEDVSVNPAPVTGGPTVSAMAAVEGTSAPELPVIVTVALPWGAEGLTEKVTRLVEVAGLTLNAAVTPLGSPEAASETPPLNPPASVIVMVAVPLPPWATESADTEDLIAKPCEGVPPKGN